MAWNKVLLVDDSVAFRDTMRNVLAPHCFMVLTAAGVAEAIETIGQNPDLDLLLCDVVMREGSGFDVLEHLRAMPAPKPSAIVVTAHPAPDSIERAFELGALDYLAKPTTVRRIMRAFESAESGPPRRINPRWRCPGKAFLVDPACDERAYVAWDLYNLNSDGAFLETKGPLPIGAELELLIEVSGKKGRVRAKVVRLQEPSWLDVAGVGIIFLETDEQAEALLKAAVERSAGEVE